WSIPFARAFGEFVRIVSQPSQPSQPGGRHPKFEISEIDPAKHPQLAARLEKLRSRYQGQKIRFTEFDPAVPARKAVSHLKQIFKQRGIKQADIARKLGVAPSVISRVLKHPERSRLSTINDIADAAGIPLGELV